VIPCRPVDKVQQLGDAAEIHERGPERPAQPGFAGRFGQVPVRKAERVRLDVVFPVLHVFAGKQQLVVVVVPESLGAPSFRAPAGEIGAPCIDLLACFASVNEQEIRSEILSSQA